MKLKTRKTEGGSLFQEKGLGILIGVGWALAGAGLCFVPGLEPDFSDFFDLSIGLTVLLLGALTVFLAKEGFLKLWAFLAGGREVSPGVRSLPPRSAGLALIVSYSLFAVVLMILIFCWDNLVRAALYLLFCLHAGCYWKDPVRAARMKGLSPKARVTVSSAGICLCPKDEGNRPEGPPAREPDTGERARS